MKRSILETLKLFMDRRKLGAQPTRWRLEPSDVDSLPVQLGLYPETHLSEIFPILKEDLIFSTMNLDIVTEFQIDFRESSITLLKPGHGQEPITTVDVVREMLKQGTVPAGAQAYKALLEAHPSRLRHRNVVVPGTIVSKNDFFYVLVTRVDDEGHRAHFRRVGAHTYWSRSDYFLVCEI